MATCSAVAHLYAGLPFLWSAPQPGEDEEHRVANDFWLRLERETVNTFHTVPRLQDPTHGLNRRRFHETCNAALLRRASSGIASHRLLEF
jgi:hypothetical protein